MAVGTRLEGSNTAFLEMSVCTPSWLGKLTYKLLTATTIIYTYAAGITMTTGIRLRGNNTACLEMSTCTACTPPVLRLSAWEGVVVLKELIFNSFYFGRVW